MTYDLPPDREKEFTTLTGSLGILTRPRSGVEYLL